MHGDAALDAAYRSELMPSTALTGEANLLVMPNIDAANIAYNLLKTAAGGGIAIGPVLAGRGQAGAHPDPFGHGAPHRQHDGADGGRRQRGPLTPPCLSPDRGRHHRSASTKNHHRRNPRDFPASPGPDTAAPFWVRPLRYKAQKNIPSATVGNHLQARQPALN